MPVQKSSCDPSDGHAAGGEAASAAAGGRSLDLGTQLPSAGHWFARAWPQAGEATVSYVPTGGGDESPSAWSVLEEQERRAKNHERATRRAVGVTRRYMVSNRLRYMWVLTFADCLQGVDGRAECMRRVAAFAERFTAVTGRQAYWYSPELHPGGHGWHVNFFVGRRVPHDKVEALWGHGFVWVKDWATDSRIKSMNAPLIVAIRLGATYGCKYASKDWGEDVLVDGAHRYEVAQGFQPDEHAERFATLAEAWAMVHGAFAGCVPERVWSSDEAEDWDAPPVYCFTFSDGLEDRLPGG